MSLVTRNGLTVRGGACHCPAGFSSPIQHAYPNYDRFFLLAAAFLPAVEGGWGGVSSGGFEDEAGSAVGPGHSSALSSRMRTMLAWMSSSVSALPGWAVLAAALP